MEGLTIKHNEELERAYGKWVLVRRSLEISSFGINAVELPPGESIPEHDESGRAHEEVFLVLDGDAVMVVDGVDYPVSRGSYARLSPERRRTVRNDSDAVASVLIISAPVASGYEPLEWA
jgi:quercetin dioxygenase-like cupin family protein